MARDKEGDENETESDPRLRRNENGAPPLPGGRRLKKIAASSGSTAGNAYQGALEACFAIVICAGAGYWADSEFGTSPRWLIVGIGVGFAAFILRLTRMSRLLEEPKSEDENNDKKGST